MKHRVSETFLSIQGEGQRTGVLSVWLRVFGCNLRCPSFFREEPEHPEKYPEPFQQLKPLSEYATLFDLPVIEHGCDSLYSIDPRFKKFATDYTTEELAAKIWSYLPGGKFQHPVTRQTYDFCITGGEPMMQQKQTVALLKYMVDQDNFPYDVQVETNGTQDLAPDLCKLVSDGRQGFENGQMNWFWSISPKLLHVSGEPDSKAWKPEVIKQYWDCHNAGWLKFVVNEREQTWKELRDKVSQLRSIGVGFPVYIMPVGSTKEMQEDSRVVGAIATRAIAEGYHVSGRLHCTLFSNTMGT